MAVLFGLLWPLERLNDVLLAIGRAIAVAALAVMVMFILGQVFFRYALDAAPSWTEEAARFGMIWMTGLMAPMAFRMGGFVSIDMLERALPRLAAQILGFVLLAASFWLLLILWDKGLNNHLDTLSGKGCSSSLRWPFGIEVGKCGEKFQNRFQYAGLWVGVNLLILVNAELLVRQAIRLGGQGDRLKPLAPAQEIAGAS